MLVTVLVRSVRYRSSRNRKTKARKMLGALFNRPNVKHIGKDSETCGGMIRNVVCLRLQRGCSKLIRMFFSEQRKRYDNSVGRKRVNDDSGYNYSS